MSHRHRAARSLHGFWLRHRASADFRRAVTASALVAVLAVVTGVVMARSGPEAHRTFDASAPPVERTQSAFTTPTLGAASGGPTSLVSPSPPRTLGPLQPSTNAPAPTWPGPTSAASSGSLPGLPGSPSTSWPAGPSSSTPRTSASSGGSHSAEPGGAETGGSHSSGPHSPGPQPGHTPTSEPSSPSSPSPKPPSSSPSPSPKPPPSSNPPPSPNPPPSFNPPPAPPPDEVPPVTTAWTISAVDGVWTVGLGADEPASFDCSLDGEIFQPCGSTVAYGGLHPGPHTLQARATDQAGNTDGSPATVSIKMTGKGNGF